MFSYTVLGYKRDIVKVFGITAPSTGSGKTTITMATVYNILRTLQKSSILKSFELKGATWFETNTGSHANFMCDVCGEITDLEIEQHSIIKSASDAGYNVTDSNYILRGVCPKCRDSQ